MTFRKFVQIGRVVFLNEGPYRGRLAVIVDVIDGNRALIDGPCSRVPRQEFRFSEMFLTSYLIKICRSQKSKGVRAAWVKADISKKFVKSEWNKNIKKDIVRTNMTDFDRFKLGRAKQMKNKILKLAYFQIKKQNQRLQQKVKAKKVAKAKKAKAMKESGDKKGPKGTKEPKAKKETVAKKETEAKKETKAKKAK